MRLGLCGKSAWSGTWEKLLARARFGEGADGSSHAERANMPARTFPDVCRAGGGLTRQALEHGTLCVASRGL